MLYPKESIRHHYVVFAYNEMRHVFSSGHRVTTVEEAIIEAKRHLSSTPVSLDSKLTGKGRRPEVQKRAGVNVQDPTPPAPAKTKHERVLKGQEGLGLGRTTIPVPAAQHQDIPVVAVGAVACTTQIRTSSISIDDLDLDQYLLPC